MNELNPRERELVALGAAMGSNCVPCIEFHIPAARKAGLDDARIVEAIRLADTVRQVPARKVLDTAMQLLDEADRRQEAACAAGTEQAAPAGAPARCCS